MPNDDSAIRIHIEIDTAESEELRKLMDKIDRADNKLSKIKGDRTARKIIENPDLFDSGAPIKGGLDKGPIFRGEEESEAVSQIARPGKGRQAATRQDAFKNMQERLNNFEEEQESLKDELEKFSPLLLVAQGGNIGGAALNFIRPLVPYIGEALAAFGFFKTVFDNLFAPGGIFDRRFKLIVQNQIDNSFTRQTRASIRQGFTTVVATSYIGPRGARSSQVFGTNQGINRNNYVYDENLERLTKGIYGI